MRHSPHCDRNKRDLMLDQVIHVDIQEIPTQIWMSQQTLIEISDDFGDDRNSTIFIEYRLFHR
jgi:hypothetical protein